MNRTDLDRVMEKLPSTAILSWATAEPGDGPADETGQVTPKKVVAIIDYSMPGFGFGELTFYTDEKGQAYIDTECTSRETVMKILKLFVDGAILDHDPNPENHHKYNTISRTTCGESCRTCYPPGKIPE